jgi:hypothetical protein
MVPKLSAYNIAPETRKPTVIEVAAAHRQGGVHPIALALITRLGRRAHVIPAVAQPFSVFGPLTKRSPRT